MNWSSCAEPQRVAEVSHSKSRRVGWVFPELPAHMVVHSWAGEACTAFGSQGGIWPCTACGAVGLCPSNTVYSSAQPCQASSGSPVSFWSWFPSGWCRAWGECAFVLSAEEAAQPESTDHSVPILVPVTALTPCCIISPSSRVRPFSTCLQMALLFFLLHAGMKIWVCWWRSKRTIRCKMVWMF